ncbi:MAG: SoxR reducing system RseC family protein [Xanthomonadales bacterium]|nr:SoxR reducing system RseC family protein [Xanthomonadales bacterium]
MAERRAVIDAVDGDVVRLRALERCSDCGGCGGRCDLFRTPAGDELTLDRQCFDLDPVPGEAVQLRLSDRWLRQSAWLVYGLATLGMLLGAGLGWLAGYWLNAGVDLLTLIGAVAGTLWAIRGSKNRLPQIRVAPLHGADPPRAESG